MLVAHTVDDTKEIDRINQVYAYNSRPALGKGRVSRCSTVPVSKALQVGNIVHLAG